MKYRGKIKADGTIEFLGYPPPGMELPAGIVRRRFSEIIPVNPVKRAVFRGLRWMFGEEGRVSDWTRAWSGPWEGRILLGPARGRRIRGLYRWELLRWEQHIWRNN